MNSTARLAEKRGQEKNNLAAVHFFPAPFFLAA
jgi:hypothetical protein